MIFHVDVNSAFLSWEAVYRLSNGDKTDLRLIPSAVGGDEQSRHGVVLAKSKPAQAFGIKTGETLYAARQKCPELVVVPSNFPLYSRMSQALVALLQAYSPIVQQFSIDECFLDYTGLAGLYGEPVKAAYDLKDRIYELFGFTVNIGVAPNKILAKMAGELKKPDMVHTMFLEELPTKLWPQPVRNLFMVGEKSEQALSLFGIHTIGDLAMADPHLIATILKSHGMMVQRYANGIDPSPVTPNVLVDCKSYSNSTTLSRDATGEKEAFLTILKLCQSVCVRMRNEAFLGATIGLQLKYSDFTTVSKQRHLKQPTDNTDQIYSILKELFTALWSGAPVRLFGVSLSDLTESTDVQISMFEDSRRKRQDALDLVCDRIRTQFGNHSIGYGAELEGDSLDSLDRFFPDGLEKKSK